METWESMRERLEDGGVTGPALELARRATANDRHWNRVMAAFDAAAMAVGVPTRYAQFRGSDGVPRLTAEHQPQDCLEIWAVLTADAFGVGGPMRISGMQTVRVPPLQSLGSGRKQAGDGPAWTAAIADAADICRSLIVRWYWERQNLSVTVKWTADYKVEAHLALPGEYVSPSVAFVGSDGEDSLVLDPNCPPCIPHSWRESIAGTGFLKTQKIGFRFDENLPVCGKTSAEDWANAYNAALRFQEDLNVDQ